MAVHAHVVDHFLGEPDRFVRDGRRVRPAVESLEVVVHHEFRRQVRVTVVLVARAVLPPGGVDLLTQRLHVGEGEALLHRSEKLLGRAHVVPHAHFVNVAGVEGVEVRPRGLVHVRRGLELKGALGQGPGAQHKGGVLHFIAVDQHGECRVVGYGVLRLHHDAVRGNERRLEPAGLAAVHVENKQRAVVGQRHMRPLAGLLREDGDDLRRTVA